MLHCSVIIVSLTRSGILDKEIFRMNFRSLEKQILEKLEKSINQQQKKRITKPFKIVCES